MAGVLPNIKRYMENDDDGYGKRVTMDELKQLTENDREDFREMLEAAGVKCD